MYSDIHPAAVLLSLIHISDGIEVIDSRVNLDKYGIRIVDDVIYTKTTVEPLDVYKRQAH